MKRQIWIIIHNIESVGSQSIQAQVNDDRILNAVVIEFTRTCQATLCRLVSCEGIRLLASIDHVNAPLIWDFYAAAKVR